MLYRDDYGAPVGTRVQGRHGLGEGLASETGTTLTDNNNNNKGV